MSAPRRRAPVHMPALPALRPGVRPPVPLPVTRRPRTLAEHVEPFLFWLKAVRGLSVSKAEVWIGLRQPSQADRVRETG